MRLSEHFALDEFDPTGEAPSASVDVYLALCSKLLEPVRAQFGREILITSGYRSPSENDAAHGVQHSQHIANGIYGAADWRFLPPQDDMRPVFDWIRATPEVEYDQLILEHDPESGHDIIHSSFSFAYNRREALEGQTANRSLYKQWPTA